MQTPNYDLKAFEICLDYYKNNNDPRVTKFYNATSIAGAIGCQQGNFNTQVSGVNFPSDLVGGLASSTNSGTAPVKLISSYESLLLQAEAVQRGYLNGSAKSLYESGITESFKLLKKSGFPFFKISNFVCVKFSDFLTTR